MSQQQVRDTATLLVAYAVEKTGKKTKATIGTITKGTVITVIAPSKEFEERVRKELGLKTKVLRIVIINPQEIYVIKKSPKTTLGEEIMVKTNIDELGDTGKDIATILL